MKLCSKASTAPSKSSCGCANSELVTTLTPAKDKMNLVDFSLGKLIVVFSLLALIALLIMLYNQNLQKSSIQEPYTKQTESIEADSI